MYIYIYKYILIIHCFMISVHISYGQHPFIRIKRMTCLLAGSTVYNFRKIDKISMEIGRIKIKSKCTQIFTRTYKYFQHVISCLHKTGISGTEIRSKFTFGNFYLLRNIFCKKSIRNLSITITSKII